MNCKAARTGFNVYRTCPNCGQKWRSEGFVSKCPHCKLTPHKAQERALAQIQAVHDAKRHLEPDESWIMKCWQEDKPIPDGWLSSGPAINYPGYILIVRDSK